MKADGSAEGRERWSLSRIGTFQLNKKGQATPPLTQDFALCLGLPELLEDLAQDRLEARCPLLVSEVLEGVSQHTVVGPLAEGQLEVRVVRVCHDTHSVGLRNPTDKKGEVKYCS